MQTPATGLQTRVEAPRQAVLHLRGATREQERELVEDGESSRARRRIKWAEDVIDNEGLGRKKSKGSSCTQLGLMDCTDEGIVCCIYHAPKAFGESSDESSSDSDDSDSGDDGSARPTRIPSNGHGHGHNHNHAHDHGKSKGKGKGRSSSPNAYEKMPRNKKGSSK